MMTKQCDFNWRRPVCQSLQDGELLDRIDEDGNVIESSCLVKVDEFGFFIYWSSEGKDGQVIDCSQINDIRSDNAVRETPAGENDSRVVCICSGLDFVSINYTYFLAKDSISASTWLHKLHTITHNYKCNNVCAMTQLQKHWLKLCLMVNSESMIPVRSITRTFASGRTEKMVMQSLEDLGFPGGKNEAIDPKDFTFEKFMDLYHKICPRTDIEDLFADISYHKNHITASQLKDFLNDVQRDPRLNEILCPFYDRHRVLQLISRYEEDPNFIQREWLSYNGFCRYLMSDENAPVFLDRLDIYQEMDHPLSHYYINSSHNTYLIGRQFAGNSSVEMYRQVLMAGCRCVELDCWDGPGNEPIITHGKAMCTDINFRDVILAIKETAFVTSEYPVILSFENHCTKPQQLLLARYCEDAFGDMLLREPLPDAPLKPGVTLPSPNQLKGKILIKNKRLKPEVEKDQLEMFMMGDKVQVEMMNTSAAVAGEDEEDSTAEDENANVESPILELAHPEQNINVEDLLVSESMFLAMKEKHDAAKTDKINLKMVGKSDSVNTEDEAQIIYSSYQYQSATTNIHPYLSHLVNYVQPVKFQGFDVAEERSVTYNMSSFNENTGLGLLKNHAIEFVNYNKRQLSRIYPRGGRVDSSNYMPQIFWNAGCQMVSLNFQTPDLAMQLNQGKFEYNGNCGYLLKPDFMRRPDREFDPFSECPVDGVIAAHCSVQVISGQFLSDRKLGTYVEVDMFGLPTDTIRKEFKTKVIPNNGLNPVYNSEPFVFRKIILPDLAILRIGVYEESGKLIGQRILPLDGLQAGYRHISLRTEGNFPLSLPTVFCKIVLKTYIPDGFDEFVNALSDPRRWLSMAEKREQQMKNLGYDESEIGDLPESAAKTGNVNPHMTPHNTLSASNSVGIFPISSQPSIKNNNSSKDSDGDSIYEEVNLELLRQSRSFMKLGRQQQKEMAVMKKKHGKDRASAYKSHPSTSMNGEKSKKPILKKKGSTASLLLCHRSGPTLDESQLPKSHSESEVASPAQLQHEKEVESSTPWKQMLSRHATEEVELLMQQTCKQTDLLNDLVAVIHETQRKELVCKQERERKALEERQTKFSLTTRKQLQADKNIKTKAELERRMNEVTENHAKRFGEERNDQRESNLRQQNQLKLLQQKDFDKISKLAEEEKAAIVKKSNPEVLEKMETVI